MEGVIRTCQVPYREIGNEGDLIAILADHGTDPRIPKAFATAAMSIGMEPIVVAMPISAYDYHDPPSPVQKAAEAADIVHYVTSRYLVHSRWGRSLSASGKRKVISDGVTYDMLTSGAVEADLDEVAHWNDTVAAAWDPGAEVHMTSKLGTDLTVSIEGRSGFVGGRNRPKEGFNIGAGATIQFPGGEGPIAPVEDTAEGVLVIDKTLQPVPSLLSSPVSLTISAGTIVGIEGGDEARWFEQWLERHGDENGRRLCEISVGTNPNARWCGNLRQDRFVWGSSHIGFGMNADVGGTIDSNIHYDVAWSQATVRVDGKLLVDNGRIIDQVAELVS